MTTSTTPLSGRQVTIAFGDYSATIASVGAALRALTFRGRDVVVSFDEDEVRPSSTGSNLVPWPNRIGGGTYEFEGETHQLVLNEPARGTSLHGLAQWIDWDVLETSGNRAVLGTRIGAQPGYPFTLEVEVAYTLDESGFTWSTRTRNIGNSRAPYGVGTHPYFTLSEGVLDDWTLVLPAHTVLEVAPDTLLPVSDEDVHSYAGGHFDLTGDSPVGARKIDHAYTSLDAVEGTATAVLSNGRQHVELAWDAEAMPWVQVFTSDLPGFSFDRKAVAVEPMTCPPDSFTSGRDLIVLEPGEVHEASIHVAASDVEA